MERARARAALRAISSTFAHGAVFPDDVDLKVKLKEDGGATTVIDVDDPSRAAVVRFTLALVSVLAYAGLRPGEAYELRWADVLDDRDRPRKRLLVHRAISGDEVTTPKSARAREPELFTPVARELVELHLAQGRPGVDALVFPDAAGGHLRRQNWRRQVWIPALERAGVPYFRAYDLRHTCATLLLYEGRTLNEVAEHLGRRPRLHRAHLRPRHAGRATPAARPDQ